ncbi:M14 family zinc carboxypeptidase [Geomicrobium sp. JCM 19055]|uniref:M14 family zinc carboxypeptidase n=1 Tax=Geomicrobium sp. JCM 19055 TaxID=1460649 RepID=UPI00045EDE2E|nr:M14 family zinc carboxypeptidase [Geomicrobium sp. JCM 19055]GAJ97373.1 zinc carboxypeptidase family protein [Geomicrobium sp. JCM 19055]
MNIEEIINKVPNYESFLTVEEMDASTRSLQENYPDIVSVKLVGHSRKGHPIECITIGTGELQALCFALPHPNEPIGAMTMEFLTKELAENESLRDSLNFTWHIIKCIDPDGTRLNEGWFKGPFDIFTYSRNFYRPGGHEQVEWTFPISYKTLDFNSPIPETKALMNLIEEIQPDFMYSLHNAGFGGAYWYITHDLPELYEDLRNSALKQEVPLNLGEPEAPFIKEFSPAVFKMMSAIDEYEHTLKYTGKALNGMLEHRVQIMRNSLMKTA